MAGTDPRVVDAQRLHAYAGFPIPEKSASKRDIWEIRDAADVGLWQGRKNSMTRTSGQGPKIRIHLFQLLDCASDMIRNVLGL